VTSAQDTVDQSVTERLPTAEAYRWYAVAWPLSILFHLAGNSDFIAATVNGSVHGVGVLQIVVAILAVALVAFPRPPLGVTLAFVFIVVTVIKAPRIGNHELILALASLILLVSAVISDRRWLATAFPGLRWLLVIAYISIAFSKLNSGFFDSSVSCAVVFGDEMGNWVGVRVSSNRVLSEFVVWTTAITELAIPVLLVIRRWRVVGVLLALSFHYVLALDPSSHVYDFTSTLFPLFLVFMPLGFHERLSKAVDSIGGRFGRFGPLALPAAIAAFVVAHGVVLASGWPVWTVAYPAWLIVGGAVVVQAFAYAVGLVRSGGWPSTERLAARLAWPLIPVIALVALNGLAPYLQLRTAAAFNMYSNLETVHVDSNHFLVRTTAGLRTSDVVVITAAPNDHPLAHYVDRGVAIPVDNLRHYLRLQSFAAGGDFDPIDDRLDEVKLDWLTTAGGEQPASVAELDPADMSWGEMISYKLGYRRPVDLQTVPRCLREWGPVG